MPSIDPDEGNITVCPECDSSEIHYRSPRGGGGDYISKWWCENCTHRFDQPERRKPKSSTIPKIGLAAKLYEKGVSDND